MATFRSILCLSLALGAFGCQRAPSGSLLKLPSGKLVRVVSIGTMHFSASHPAWMLKYETKTPIVDVPELRQDATEISQQYKGPVDRAGMSVAILSAHEPAANTVISKTG